MKKLDEIMELMTDEMADFKAAILKLEVLSKQLSTFKHLQSASVGRVISAILVFSFVVYLIPGLFGALLKPLAGYLPPLGSQSLICFLHQVMNRWD